MDIEETLKDLGPVEIARLREAVIGLKPADWSAQRIRQNEYEVHRQTESVVLVFTDGSGWPQLEVKKEQGWDLLAKTAVPIMHIGRTLSRRWHHHSVYGGEATRRKHYQAPR